VAALSDHELTYFFDTDPFSGTAVTPAHRGSGSSSQMPGTGPWVESVSVDPPLVEHGGGIDVTVQFRNATLIRIQAPDGVQTDFTVDFRSNSGTFHLLPCFGGVISVTAINPAAATASDPLGRSPAGTASVRTYTLPPLDFFPSLYYSLGAPVVQIHAPDVVLGEPARTELTELARLHDGIAGLPALPPDLMPVAPPALGFPFPFDALTFIPGTGYPAPDARAEQQT
jgi:hypothetical protein